MTTTEILMLVQAIIMLATGAVIAWYTLETRRLRQSAAGQFEVMWRTYDLQLEEMRRAAEPIFLWGGGLASENRVEWQFRNEGGAIDRVTITMQSPTGAATGIQATIKPQEWLEAIRKGAVVGRALRLPSLHSGATEAVALQFKIRKLLFGQLLGNSREGVAIFDGNVRAEFRFTVGFRTRLGGVGGFFFLASHTTRPIYTGSGWV